MNATLQQRLVPVRLFYDYLIEEGLRESNPVGRGRYTPGRKYGGHQRGTISRVRGPLFNDSCTGDQQSGMGVACRPRTL